MTFNDPNIREISHHRAARGGREQASFNSDLLAWHIHCIASSGMRRVLLVIEDATLAELLMETLGDAGHEAALADGADSMRRALRDGTFYAAIVDLDTRARDGARLVEGLRSQAPSTIVIALLPCGVRPIEVHGVPYHLALEKPARLGAVLAALNLARPA